MLKIQVCTLPLNATTEDGRYFAKVNGLNVGTPDRGLFETKREALACALNYVQMTGLLSDRKPSIVACPQPLLSWGGRKICGAKVNHPTGFCKRHARIQLLKGPGDE